MPVYKFRCKGCGHQYVLKVHAPGALVGKSFQCAKCGLSKPYCDFVPGVPSPLKTHIATPSPSDAVTGSNPKTVVAHLNVCGRLVVESSRKTIPLSEGTHVLGRESSDSSAGIKIAADPYMSRQHARLSVRSVATGEKIFRLSALSSINAVFVNDRRLVSGETVELRFGDTILLGKTNIKLAK